jgi:flavin-dependent dehydrogenase
MSEQPSIPAAADVVVLGGGPAGSAAARLLASWGHDVVIVARAPTHRTIAESLPPSSTKLLDRVGVRDAVDAAGFIRATGNTVRWGDPSVPERVERFAGEGLGYQIVRDTFDAVLLEEARGAGARVMSGVTGRVARNRDEIGRLIVRYGDGEARQSIAATWVLDCTGSATSRWRGGGRRLEGMGAHAEPRTVALMGIWNASAWELADDTHTLVESYDGGWAWSVPVSRTRRYVTVMLDPSVTRLAGRRGIDVHYEEELARTRWIGPLAARVARIEGGAWACDATQRIAPRIVEDHLLRVGDAASFVDPLSSYGVKKALASAWLAAVAVHSAAVDSTSTAPALELYEKRERAMYASVAGRAARLAADAGTGHASAFWNARQDFDPSVTDAVGAEDGPDIAALRDDPRIQAAFAELRRRPSIHLAASGTGSRVSRPIVVGNRIVVADHLVTTDFPHGIRYLRNVDLVVLSALAVEQTQVGDLYEAYSRATTPVPLPDFLGALSALIGTEMLLLA